jgi:hypothetical protein
MYPMPYKEAGSATIEIMNMKKAASASTRREILNIGNEVCTVAVSVDLVSNRLVEKISVRSEPNIEKRFPM